MPKKGQTQTPEARAKISKALKGNTHGRGRKGKKASEETKIKLSESHKGKKFSEGARYIMSLIGIWGHSAIGKTTWLESIQNDLKAINRKIVLVYADVQLERRPFKDGWFEARHSRWKGEKHERQEILPTMIADSKIWILESMRWFIGMQPDLTAGFKANGNSGLHMIILHSNIEVQKQWRLERCQLLGKPWNPYWDKLGNLKVENNRGLNSMKKHFHPAGVPCKDFKIGYARREFAEVTAYIKGIIQP